MALLRKIGHPTLGNTQAWAETFLSWESCTRGLGVYSKGARLVDDSMIGMLFILILTKRLTIKLT